MNVFYIWGFVLCASLTATCVRSQVQCSQDAKKCAERFIDINCKFVQSSTCTPLFINCMSEKKINTYEGIGVCQAQYAANLSLPGVAYKAICQNDDYEDAHNLGCCICEHELKTSQLTEIQQAKDECMELASKDACNQA